MGLFTEIEAQRVPERDDLETRREPGREEHVHQPGERQGGGCQGAGEAISGLHQPTVELDFVRLKEINADSATFEAIFSIHNPYSAPLTVAGYDYRMTSGGTQLLSGRYEAYVSVPANGRVVLPTSFPIDFEQVTNSLVEARPGQVVPYQVEFSVIVTPPGRSLIRLPASHAGELPLPVPPKISLLYVLWEEVLTEYISATLYLDMVNPNDFELHFTELDCSLAFTGEEISDVKVRRDLGFPAGGARKFTVPFSFFPVETGIATVRLIAESGADYLLTGTLTGETRFGTMTLPVSSEGRARFRK